MIALLTITAALAAGPDEAQAAEARHLTNIRQVTSGFARAGQGHFRPAGRAIIFQAVPNPPPAVFHTPAPHEDAYQIFTADLEPDAVPKLVSTGKGQCTCAYYHPDGQSILFASTHRNPGPDAGPRGPAYSRSE